VNERRRVAPVIFPPGTLWQSIIRTTEHALRSGALVPLSTSERFIEDSGVRFVVRVWEGLRRKKEAQQQEAAGLSGKPVNPFLPPDPDLTVAEVSDTHLALLNKFNVVEHHLLIVTKRFEDQDTLLTVDDIKALWTSLAEYNSLGFYNGGREAGASQQHKHLQVVPLPLASKGPRIPLEPLFTAAPRTGITTLPALPFNHVFVRLDTELTASSADAPLVIHGLYAGLLRALGMQTPDPGLLSLASAPYCLLLTREWMLLVPRSREHFEDISLNSLAFAGSLFVQNEAQFRRLESFGPMNALKSVTLPPRPSPANIPLRT
jgi:ATP adenylyltransferase